MIGTSIYKYDLFFDEVVEMSYKRVGGFLTVFTSFAGNNYTVEGIVDDFEGEHLSEQELFDYFFEEYFKEELELDFKPDYEGLYELSNYEFYREKL